MLSILPTLSAMSLRETRRDLKDAYQVQSMSQGRDGLEYNHYSPRSLVISFVR